MNDNVNQFLENRYDPVNNRTIFYDNDERIKTILSLVGYSSKKLKALDIACYDGTISKVLKDKIVNCEMYGIDYSNNTEKLVIEKGLKFKKVDLNKGIDFDDNTFDIIFAGEIIEHIYDTDLFVQEIKRILKPNGKFIVTTPNLVSFGRRIMYLFGVGAFMEASLTYPKKPLAAGHIRFYTHKLLIDFMKFNKFELIKSTSDTVNLFVLDIPILAKIFPTLGRGVICKFRNIK
jgi:ubiquinone/menaquinone biosynthesis C-methylase UbiE